SLLRSVYRTLEIFVVKLCSRHRPPCTTLFPYTTLFRSWARRARRSGTPGPLPSPREPLPPSPGPRPPALGWRKRFSRRWKRARRSEEHTSELQSQSKLVCSLLLEKKKKKKTIDLLAVYFQPSDIVHATSAIEEMICLPATFDNVTLIYHPF